MDPPIVRISHYHKDLYQHIFCCSLRQNTYTENRIEKIFIDNANLSEFTFDEVIDLEGKYLGPAFIDVHTHGADGADAMDGSEEALRKISKYLVQEGTANFLATTLTSSKEILKDVLKVVANLQDKDIEGANIFGVHMEGPYFAV